MNWSSLVVVGTCVCSFPSSARCQESPARARPILSTPKLPGVEMCTIATDGKVTAVDRAKLAAAFPGACVTSECVPLAMKYCTALVAGKSDSISKAYLDLAAIAYPPDKELRTLSAASGHDGATAATPAGVSWEGALLGGLASFLAVRAQAETITWILDQLRDRICGEGPNARDRAGSWFPKTCVLARDDSGYAASPPGRIFVAAVREDVEGFPSRVIQFAVTKLNERSLPELGDTLQFFYDAGVAIRSERDVVKALTAVVAADRYRTSCHGWKTKLEARCALATAATVFVALYPKVAADDGGLTPDEVSALLHALTTDAEFKNRLTQLFGGELPPDVAIWLDEARIAAFAAKVERLIDEITRLRTAITAADDTLPETSGAAVRRVEALVHPLLGVVAAVTDFFDAGSHVPNRARLFAVLRTVESFADTLDVLLAAVRAIRQGKRPLEVVAGLSRDPRLRRQCPGAKVSIPIGCAVATAALFLEHAGGIAIAADGPLLDTVATLLYEATLRRGSLQRALVALYDIRETDPAAVRARLPPFLGRVIDAGELANGDVIQPVLRFLDSVQTFDATLTKMAASSTPKAALEQAPTVLREAIDVIDAGTSLVGASTIPYREEILVAADAMALIVAGDYAEGLRKTIDLFGLLASDPAMTLPEGIRRHLSLVVDLASAHTPEDVEAALESAAAPVGSWRRKHHELTASVTAFVGLTGGYETPRTEGIRSDVPSGLAAGALAAVGIDVSFPVLKKSSMGFFVSVLDLGQLTSSRLTSTVKGTDDNEVRANTTPEVDFAQVFSPGLYWHVSLGGSPFTVAGGASFAPALRTYFFSDPADPPTRALSTWRVGAFLAVDVTVLPF